jgi:hypothetical protein
MNMNIVPELTHFSIVMPQNICAKPGHTLSTPKSRAVRLRQIRLHPPNGLVGSGRECDALLLMKAFEPWGKK